MLKTGMLKTGSTGCSLIFAVDLRGSVGSLTLRRCSSRVASINSARLDAPEGV